MVPPVPETKEIIGAGGAVMNTEARRVAASDVRGETIGMDEVLPNVLLECDSVVVVSAPRT